MRNKPMLQNKDLPRYGKNLLVSRPYLLACRRIILTESEPTVENWKDMVNFNDLRAFDDADFVH